MVLSILFDPDGFVSSTRSERSYLQISHTKRPQNTIILMMKENHRNEDILCHAPLRPQDLVRQRCETSEKSQVIKATTRRRHWLKDQMEAAAAQIWAAFQQRWSCSRSWWPFCPLPGRQVSAGPTLRGTVPPHTNRPAQTLHSCTAWAWSI